MCKTKLGRVAAVLLVSPRSVKAFEKNVESNNTKLLKRQVKTGGVRVLKHDSNIIS